LQGKNAPASRLGEISVDGNLVRGTDPAKSVVYTPGFFNLYNGLKQIHNFIQDFKMAGEIDKARALIKEKGGKASDILFRRLTRFKKLSDLEGDQRIFQGLSYPPKRSEPGSTGSTRLGQS
jgi:hypothetical protein